MARPTTRRTAPWLVALGALVAASCHSKGSTVLVVTVGLSGSLPAVSALDVTVSGGGNSARNVYGGGSAIVFPTTFAAELSSAFTGELILDVKALDAGEKTLAHGRADLHSLRVGARQDLSVVLDCGGTPCAVPGADAGAPGTPDGGAGNGPSCGNGRIDLDETCDTAIAPGAPGACPPASCDDGIPCTVDTHVGQGCEAECHHVEVKDRVAGDGCCPASASSKTDPDCSATCGDGHVDHGETCDTALAAGAPGACAMACDDGDPCTVDAIVSAGTCSAICAHTPITRQSGSMKDGCCPAGAWSGADADCPSECGDGRLDVDERCDPGLPPGDAHACPTTCDDGDPCTVDVRSGSGCQTTCTSTPITALVSGDGCCPVGATSRTDRDCAPVCGNGIVELGEACDKGASSASDACPKTCAASPAACLKNALVGDAAVCTARCELQEITRCGGDRDGCCAAGCNADTDPDCSPTCGDGVVQTANGETCDTAIAAGKPGACPTSCSDGLACTRDVLVAHGTCQATCLFLPITTPRAGDGCCVPGSDAALDPDCEPLCGNGVAEGPGETCDYGAGPFACPTAASCAAGNACTPIGLEGLPAACNARCVAHPVSACVSGDGCCPPSCTIANDSDCPAVCGDGVLTAGEACDRGITTGQPGSCARTCDDGDACTADWAAGTVEGCSRTCSHAPITACRGGDGCCPAGCDADADPDCAPTCGDGLLGAGETCDPPSTCPATCPDDGDTCTREVLAGDASRCSATCTHQPITACSGTVADFCCPTGCSAATDADCPATGLKP